MIKRTITSMNAMTGEEETKDYYFHLNKADLLRIMGRDRTGNWEKYVESIVNSGDNDKVLDFIELIIRDSVGYVTPDGLFVKPKDYAESFVASDAYGELFIELIQANEEQVRDFFQAVVGNKVKQQSGQVAALTNRNGRRRNKKK